MSPIDPTSNPLLHADIRTALAADVAAYLKAFREQDMPYELAEQLTRDYHAALLAWITKSPFHSLVAASAALKEMNFQPPASGL